MASLHLFKYVNVAIFIIALLLRKKYCIFWHMEGAFYVIIYWATQLLKTVVFWPTLLNIIVLLRGLIVVGRLLYHIHVMFDIHLILSLIFCMRSVCQLSTVSSTVRRRTFGTRAFSVAGPTVWNSLPDCLRDPAVDSEQFRRDLKTYLFAGHSRR